MAAPIRLASEGRRLETDTLAPLLVTNIGGTVSPDTIRTNFLVSPDGYCFLVNTVTEAAIQPITVILKWKASP